MRIAFENLTRPKSAAKRLQWLVTGLKLHEAQQAVARTAGYRDWHDLEQHHAAKPRSLDDDSVSCETYAERVLIQNSRLASALGLVYGDAAWVRSQIGLCGTRRQDDYDAHVIRSFALGQQPYPRDVFEGLSDFNRSVLRFNAPASPIPVPRKPWGGFVDSFGNGWVIAPESLAQTGLRWANDYFDFDAHRQLAIVWMRPMESEGLVGISIGCVERLPERARCKSYHVTNTTDHPAWQVLRGITTVTRVQDTWSFKRLPPDWQQTLIELGAAD